MTQLNYAATSTRAPVSPLMLSDRLLRLAEDADSAGFRTTAEHLLDMASQVLDAPRASRSRSTPRGWLHTPVIPAPLAA